MSGMLHVVGLGPGDPELMTLKAARVIGAARVVAFFSKKGRIGHARRIADAHVSAEAVELQFEYPFTTEIALDDPRYAEGIVAFYEECAATVQTHLAAGCDVALLCEGDPFFYGSAMYIFDRIRADHPTAIIPGIPGMAGAWAQAKAPITHGDDVLTVLPGTLDEDTLTARLANSHASVIMKIGRNLDKIRRALTRAGVADRAIYVERATMEGELICPVEELERAPAPYFALVLVPGRQGAR